MANTILRTRKKLAEAARIWAGGEVENETTLGADDAVVVKLKAQGAPPEIIENYRQQIRSRYIGFDVHQDNWFSFNTFTQLKTQWEIQFSEVGVFYLGLNYTRVESFLRMKQFSQEQIASLIDDIQIMEQAALAVYNSHKT